MRKTKKKVLGLLGLILVAAITCFAASLPGPKATAVSSFTDTIVVRVVGNTPDVNITSPENEAIFVDPNAEVHFDYENVRTATAELTYTDLDGNEYSESIAEWQLNYDAGDSTITINLNNYGYGDYLVKITGIGYDDVKDIEQVKFSYVSIYTEIEEDPNTGLIYLNLYYLEDVVCKADINLYLGDKLIAPPSTIKVTSPTHRVEIPFAGLATGDYIIRTTAYSCDTGEKIGKEFEDNYYYEAIPVPDTGGFFTSGNISREDFMITGTIVFLGFGGLAIWIVAKGRKDSKRRK